MSTKDKAIPISKVIQSLCKLPEESVDVCKKLEGYLEEKRRRSEERKGVRFRDHPDRGIRYDR